MDVTRVIRSFSCVLLALVLLCRTVGAEEAKKKENQDPKGAHAYYTIESPAGRVFEGIHLTSVNRLGYINRKFLVGTDGQGVVLTKIIDATGGRSWSRILDDETGWWLEIIYDYGLSWPTLQHGLVYMGENSRPNREQYPTVDIKVETSEGTLFETRASLKANAPVEAMLAAVNGLLAEEKHLATVPLTTQVVSALLFNLRRLSLDPARNIGGDSMDTVWLVDALTEGSARKELETEWKVTPSEFLKSGLLMKEPHLLAVTRQFKSIDPVDPMQGFHTAERFPVRE